MKLRIFLAAILLSHNLAYALPGDFVYLENVDASILQEMRYGSDHNFVGRPIKGYEAQTCILTRQAAKALSLVQQELLKKSLSLKVYDCYRPAMAVTDFMTWSQNANHAMKNEFYPNINKTDVFRLGYVAAKSGHSRGSTMDLTIVSLSAKPSENIYKKGQSLIACTAPYGIRFHDNSLDMGTGYDCLDIKAHFENVSPTSVAYQNRQMLRDIMIKNGFQPYEKEWWHFTLNHEPYPETYFNFIVGKS